MKCPLLADTRYLTINLQCIKGGIRPFILPAILLEPPPSLIRPLQTIAPPDRHDWGDLAQCYLQLAVLYGQCVVERAGQVQAGWVK